MFRIVIPRFREPRLVLRVRTRYLTQPAILGPTAGDITTPPMGVQPSRIGSFTNCSKCLKAAFADCRFFTDSRDELIDHFGGHLSFLHLLYAQCHGHWRALGRPLRLKFGDILLHRCRDLSAIRRVLRGDSFKRGSRPNIGCDQDDSAARR